VFCALSRSQTSLVKRQLISLSLLFGWSTLFKLKESQKEKKLGRYEGLRIGWRVKTMPLIMNFESLFIAISIMQ